MSSFDPILRLPQVLEMTGISESTIRRLESCGDFPPRLKLSARLIGWQKSTIEAWLAGRLPVE